MKDEDLYERANMTSASPAMFERRRRILDQARRIIGEGHPDGFSVRDLGRRAGVAPNTIYNAFGDKDTVIALAILDYFEEFHRAVSFEADADTLAGVIERELAITVRNLVIPHYVRAVTTLYFSPAVKPRVREALHDVSGRAYLPWLRTLRASRQLERGIDLERATRNLAGMLYAQVQEWRIGEVSDESFPLIRVDAVLSYLAGITRGPASKEVRALHAEMEQADGRVKRWLKSAYAGLDGRHQHGDSGDELK